MAYETIAIRKLTPAIGAEVSGVDLAVAVQPAGERAARCADGASRAVLPRPADERRPAQGVRPPVRRASGPSGSQGRGRGPSRDPRRACRREDQDGDGRGLAFRHVVRARAADGLDPLPAPVAAGRRRHGLRQHVSRLRDPVGTDQAPGRGPVGLPHQRACLFARRVRALRQEVPRGRPSHRAHASGDARASACSSTAASPSASRA